jgi:hypothetical protein
MNSDGRDKNAWKILVGKPLGHDQCDHLYGTTSLGTVTINNHKSNSKFDSEISIARNVISVT